MNKKLKSELKNATSALARAEMDKDFSGINNAYSEINTIVTAIYREKRDVPTVLRVEGMINDAYVNLPNNTQHIADQTQQVFDIGKYGEQKYKDFTKRPELHVEIQQGTAKYVKIKGQPIISNATPIDAVRHSLRTFRKQIETEGKVRGYDPTSDRGISNTIRHDALAKAERGYIEEFVNHGQGTAKEKEQIKEKALRNFDKQITRDKKVLEPKKEKERPEGRGGRGGRE